jgi:glycine reductase
MSTVKAIHYVNQFYGQIGGEEKAGYLLEVRDGPVALGKQLELAFGGSIKIVKTLVCGDNYAAEHMEKILPEVLGIVKESGAVFFLAGPSFGAGRYGMACATLCQAVSKDLHIPVLAAMNTVSPGVDIAKRDIYIVETLDSARDMKNALATMGRLGAKLLKNEPIGLPNEEGYIPRAIRVNVREEKRGSRRAVDMLIKKLHGQPYTTELPMPVFDHVPPAPAIKNLKTAIIAIGTEGGIVPRGNPDRIEAHNASKWRCYNIAGIEKLASGDYEVAHGGYDPVHGNANPNRVLPLDVARACRKEAAFGELFNGYPVTVGNVTAVRSAEKYGREMGEMLKKEKVDGIVLTST